MSTAALVLIIIGILILWGIFGAMWCNALAYHFVISVEYIPIKYTFNPIMMFLFFCFGPFVWFLSGLFLTYDAVSFIMKNFNKPLKIYIENAETKRYAKLKQKEDKKQRQENREKT